MNFEDEPYVRLYSRKTLTSKQLGWEGRVVLRMMLDEFDAAGIFAIRGDVAQCIAAITDLPIEIARVGLARLIETETWVVTARAITWPTYEEAQNCSRSDRVRQRESRRARAAHSVTDVTPRAARVTDVTAGHAESQPVTPSHSRSQNVTLPPSHPPILPPSPPPVGESARDAEPPSAVGFPRAVGGPVRAAWATTMPTKTPPQEYLDEATMRAIPLEQARSTWSHYWGAGLPQGGVERLHDWLLQRAKERSTKNAHLAREGPRRSGSAQRDHGVDGWAESERKDAV